MKKLFLTKPFRNLLGITSLALLPLTLAWGVEPNTRTFTAGQQAKVQGTIIARDGQTLKLRGDDDSVGTIDITNDTKIQLKHGIFSRKNAMNIDSLVAGLRVEAQGKGNDKGELVADRVVFDPNSMKASRQIDTRVSPLESRTGTLEGRAGQLEGRAGQLETRAGQIEGRQGQLENQEKQTQQQVGQVKTAADQANQGVNDVNQRVSNLDQYQQKYKETVYFRVNSSVLAPAEKQKLDAVIQQTQNEKGYVVEVAGFADTTGNASLNQSLSEARANAVVRYLEQQGNIPIHRILTPAGMGTSHEAADNKTSQGRKLNRRVEVTVLINQGVVTGSTSSPSNSNAPAAPATPKQPGGF
jgi:outer membrane protein OmpA-like peptidoglycan-associated protein